ncbi:MAG: hypothetical protein PHG91_12630 [Syntrophales bacterium]|nr:hypothetical protein [Syntrophales bacterium]MDD5234231.1 hypothetical protein [Syntrophales bacterium]MDD5532216.1 hypothetical protein [Syntrophales bacterium]
MKRFIPVFFILFLVLLSGTAFGGAATEFGFNYFYFDYKEDLVTPHKSSDYGWLPGIYGSVEYRGESRLYARLYGSYAGGEITYDGSTQGGTPLYFTDERERLYLIEGNLGWIAVSDGRSSVVPYLGYGYFYWERGRSRRIGNVQDYQEDYRWSYIPVGVRVDYRLNEKWGIGMNAAAHIMFGGKMTAYFAEANLGNDLTFDLGNRTGYLFEVPVSWRVMPGWSLVGTPWYKYSEIGESNVVGGFYEPSSRTHQYGVKLGLSHSF